MSDFTGFSFNGIHSSELGILRVSEGDRYNEILHPEFEDKYNSIPGNDGTYYFGSNYGAKSISISIAFDSVTEEQFRHITRLFSTKQICELIFDERPYKVYAAKLAQPIQLSYICFDELKKNIALPRDGVRVIRGTEIIDGEEVQTWEREQVTPYIITDEKQRIYKGEGTIEFICTYPFAREQFKRLDQYGPFDTFTNNFGEKFTYDSSIAPGNAITTYTNINEWAPASGILTNEEYEKWKVDQVITDISKDVSGYTAYIPIYNPGDRPAPYFLFLPYVKPSDITKGKGKLNGTTTTKGETGYNVVVNTQNAQLIIQPFESDTTYDKENGVIINTRNHLIEGVNFGSDPLNPNGWVTTGNLYNWAILAGDFATLKNQDWTLDWRYHGQSVYINLNKSVVADARIFYNYIYY